MLNWLRVLVHIKCVILHSGARTHVNSPAEVNSVDVSNSTHAL